MTTIIKEKRMLLVLTEPFTLYKYTNIKLLWILGGHEGVESTTFFSLSNQ